MKPYDWEGDSEPFDMETVKAQLESLFVDSGTWYAPWVQRHNEAVLVEIAQLEALWNLPAYDGEVKGE